MDTSKHNLTEHDLDRLINEKLSNCENLPNVCKFLHTDAGKQSIIIRIKEIIFNDGITDIDAALGHIESELIWS